MFSLYSSPPVDFSRSKVELYISRLVQNLTYFWEYLDSVCRIEDKIINKNRIFYFLEKVRNKIDNQYKVLNLVVTP